ncbi:hypothetical protein NJ7G_2444 [Natrinema sp. J7-2]|nr:hypothetical protein NJ7G_2444 [Natrinema sp. J7-2]
MAAIVVVSVSVPETVRFGAGFAFRPPVSPRLYSSERATLMSYKYMFVIRCRTFGRLPPRLLAISHDSQ